MEYAELIKADLFKLAATVIDCELRLAERAKAYAALATRSRDELNGNAWPYYSDLERATIKAAMACGDEFDAMESV